MGAEVDIGAGGSEGLGEDLTRRDISRIKRRNADGFRGIFRFLGQFRIVGHRMGDDGRMRNSTDCPALMWMTPGSKLPKPMSIAVAAVGETGPWAGPL